MTQDDESNTAGESSATGAFMDDAVLLAKLNLETAKLPWRELEVFFARGIVINVAAHMSLVEVAATVARDEKNSLAQWIEQGHVGQVSNVQAREWHANESLLWTVVVKPWVFVQLCPKERGGS